MCCKILAEYVPHKLVNLLQHTLFKKEGFTLFKDISLILFLLINKYRGYFNLPINVAKTLPM